MLEFTQAEQTAKEAQEAITQADAFAAEQGENLDPDAKAEIDALKTEADEAQKRFEEVKIKLEELKIEIDAFESSEQKTTPVEVAAEQQIEAKQTPTAETETSVATEKIEATAEEKPDEAERALEIVEGHFQKLEQSLTEAKTAIQAVENMEAGSREKYDAAFKMRDQTEGISFADATVAAVLEYADTSNNSEGAQKIEAAKQKLGELKSEYKKALKEMMMVWWNAKGQHEGGKSAEIAKDYTEISKADITPNQAKQMLFSKELDDGGREYVATELMKKFIDSGRDEDAVNIAALARENGFYKSTNIDSVSADLATSLKYKNPTLYEKVKSVLFKDTRPYV